MSLLQVATTELAAAFARGVRQCVVIGSKLPLTGAAVPHSLRLFSVDESTSETLPAALELSDFDRRKPGLFLWLGGAGYQTVEAMLASLRFIASLPQGSGLIFDYAEERHSLEGRTRSALDALASKLTTAGGSVKYLIQPQAVTALLHQLGFREVLNQTPLDGSSRHARLVSALV